jgi:hypothetical protein
MVKVKEGGRVKEMVAVQAVVVTAGWVTLVLQLLTLQCMGRWLHLVLTTQTQLPSTGWLSWTTLHATTGSPSEVTQLTIVAFKQCSWLADYT